MAANDQVYAPTGTTAQCALPVDFLAWERHYCDHLAPTYEALPGERRGRFYCNPAIIEHAQARGTEAVPFTLSLPGEGPLVVAAYSDLQRGVNRGKPRPLVLSEHGCGFRFGTNHTSYAGGRGLRRHVALFLCPNDYVLKANRRTYPTAGMAVVGCPKLDRWHRESPKERGAEPVIAVSFHWQCLVTQEARSAWPYYKDALPALAERYKVLGHGHPRILDNLIPHYEAMGIEVVRDFEEVLARADLYINDASSTLYEFASLDRPVVVLNAPIYRRYVNYGLRFWDYADVGVNCDAPGDLLGAVEEALTDAPAQQAKRRAAIEAVYPVRGDAAERATKAIMEISMQTTRPTEPPPGVTVRTGKGIVFGGNPVQSAVERAVKLPGHMSRGEMGVLARMALSARSIVELGVWQGRSLAAMRLANGQARCTGVDWFRDMSHLGYSGSSADRVRLNLVRLGIGDARIIAQPTDEAAKVYNESIDFLHVDAGHSAEEVEADIALWLPKVSKGGAVAFHDYGPTKNPVLNRPEVTSTVDDWRNGEWAEVERDGRQVAFRHLIAERGVLYVAYGDRARAYVGRSIEALCKLAPGLPVAIVSDKPLGLGEHFIWHPDIHGGARLQKTRMYSLSPFRQTLYLDADTEPLQSPESALGLLEWFDLVMGIDLAGTVRAINYKNLNQDEVAITKAELPCSEVLYYNSGVIAFRRSEANRRFFQAWHREWLRWQAQDQPALARALYANPVRVATMRPPFNSNKREVARFVFHNHHAVRRGNAPK